MPWRVRDASCSHCGDAIAVKINGPTPSYCSNGCRQAAYRERNGLVGARRRRHTRTTEQRRRLIP